jgi:hypothetical protein
MAMNTLVPVLPGAPEAFSRSILTGEVEVDQETVVLWFRQHDGTDGYITMENLGIQQRLMS